MRYQTHLTKRGRIYYARVRIPTDLIAAFDGRQELKISLRTSVRSEAIPLVRRFSAQCTDLFEQRRRELQSGGASQ